MKVNCATCNKEINRKPSYVKKHKPYCSQKCRKQSMLKGNMIKCETCGKEVWKTPTDIKKAKNGKLFCSHSCSAKYSNKQRGRNRYNHREIAFSNFEHKCDICGYNKIIDILQVHHINRNRRDNSIKNLQILCPNCHNEIHYKDNDGLFWNNKKKTKIVP